MVVAEEEFLWGLKTLVPAEVDNAVENHEEIVVGKSELVLLGLSRFETVDIDFEDKDSVEIFVTWGKVELLRM